MKNVVIVGGGFTGTLAAVNLARLSTSPLRVTIVNHENPSGRGIAYSTRNVAHLLNVAARNMSALADQPNHFVEWLGTRSEYLDLPAAFLREQFIPRKIYGDYLQNLFLWFSSSANGPREIQLETIRDEAVDVIPGTPLKVQLAGGTMLEADKIILAVGNQTPTQFKLRGLNPEDARHIGNPWGDWERHLGANDRPILLVGTGLTMVDAFLSLKSAGWHGKIFATSRNGLLPLSHFKGQEYPDLLDENTGNITLRKMLGIFQRHYRDAKAGHINPAILVDKLRPFTQRLWQNFSVAEKRRFNRHFRTPWNVTRHRIAPSIHLQLTEAIADGRLEIIKGRLRECREGVGGNLAFSIETGGVARVIEAGSIVNCTGPRESYVDSTLIGNLQKRGTVRADEMNMGIKVGPNFSVLDAGGNYSDAIYAVGSLLKGTLWETTAVPELRSQAFRLAEIIASQLPGKVAEKPRIAEVFDDVMEYSI